MSFSKIAEEISKHCKVLDSFIDSERMPAPSLEFGDLSDFTFTTAISPEIRASRQALLDTATELHDLAAGPAAMVVWPILTAPYQLSVLRIIHKFSIPEAIPIAHGISVKEIAEKTCQDEEFVSRIIRLASSYHIFRVSESDGMISHTPGSKAILHNQAVRDSLTTCLDQGFLDTATFLDYSTLKNKCIDEPKQTAFNLAFDTTDDYLTFIRNPANRKYLRAVKGLLDFVMGDVNMGARNHDMDLLARDWINWEALGDGLVVDMGGCFGHVSVSIAKKHSKLRFVIQDLPDVVSDGSKALQKTSNGDQSIASRISFMEHDFLEPQPVTDADVYMFRFVVHDWPDKYVVRILRNIRSAMKDGSRIIIMDYLLAAPGTVARVVERLERTMDLVAMSIIAGKERSISDWERLVSEAGNGLKILDVISRINNAFGLVVLGF